MANLYTPQPAGNLDWLADLTRSGQRLWQNERQLALDAERLQMAKQQQFLQTQQFWATQARLRDQQEFQDRKFLFDVSTDARNFERQKITQDRNFTLGQQAESRLGAGQAWDMSPDNPNNQYRAAATLNTQVNTAETLQKMDENAQPAQWGTPQLPTGPGESAAPSLFEPTGNPYMPGTINLPDGRQADIIPNSIDEKGRPTSYYPSVRPTPKTGAAVDPAEERKALDDNINDLQTRLGSLTSSLMPVPSIPAAADDAQKAQFNKQVQQVSEVNAPVQQQLAQVQRDLKYRTAQRRLMDASVNLPNITPEFMESAPGFLRALQSRDVVGMENMRIPIKVLADKGDPTAAAAMKLLDDIFGKGVETKAKTPYF